VSVRVVTVHDERLVELTDDEADFCLPVDPDTDSSFLIRTSGSELRKKILF
jgi:hypothetical protein